jgi:hypothetical protein
MTLHNKESNDENKLAQRDLKLIQIYEEIKNKKDLILKKKKDLSKKKNVNAYLEIVNADYENYYNYILEQKKKELDAMNILNEYIDDLVNTDKLVDTQLKTAKRDQREILNEISKIKGELDKLIA